MQHEHYALDSKQTAGAKQALMFSLPVPLTSLLGREQEVAQICSCMRDVQKRMFLDYLQQYLRLPTKQVEQILEYLQRPFRERYIFTYTAGAELMWPWLQGTNRHNVLARFLTEPITPSALLG